MRIYIVVEYGHKVTYLTMRHWDANATPDPPIARIGNAATDLLEDAEGGLTARSEFAGDIAVRIVVVRNGGQKLCDFALARFRRDAQHHSPTSSLDVPSAVYGSRP